MRVVPRALYDHGHDESAENGEQYQDSADAAHAAQCSTLVSGDVRHGDAKC